jgi:hypothetical protein
MEDNTLVESSFSATINAPDVRSEIWVHLQFMGSAQE